MEGNSCSTICFDAVNVKREPEYGFNEQEPCNATISKNKTQEKLTLPWWSVELAAMKKNVATRRRRIRNAAPVRRQKVVEEYLKAKEEYVMKAAKAQNSWKEFCGKQDKEELHVKEEVVECLKEEAAWEDSVAAGSAAALAELYAGHEVKDELVLGPEVLQPQDVAFTLHALAVKKQHKLRDCVVRLERIDAPAPPSTQQLLVHPGSGQEGNVLARAGGQRGGRGETGRGSTGEHGHCCRTCNNTFTAPSLLRRHERTHTGERPYSCGTCNKKFIQSGHLKRHERTHTGEKYFSCGICKRKLTSLSHLKCHELIHTGEKPFSCGTCNKKFTQSGSLKSHERTHTGDKPFSCEICKRKFTTSSLLRCHERIHTGEKPFSCRTCNKKFALLGTLKCHERTHTGDKPFSCRTCNKKFTQSGGLKSHERSHTGDKPFSCEICKKKFAHSSTTKRHERSHTGEEQFTHLVSLKSRKDRVRADRKLFCCDICQKRFKQKTTLVGHIRRHSTAKPR